jgi:uncharacterized LabA/DUF88 family protein
MARGRFALFIDGANLYATTRVLGFDIDYSRLLSYFSTDGFLIRALYYTALLPENELSPMRPLVDYLDYNGYTVISKPAKRFTDSTGAVRIKGNMDIDLCLDMFKLKDKVDTMVLMTGDGDFRPLVEFIQNQGVRVEVISTKESKPPMIADELRRQADVFTDLIFMRKHIERDTNRSKRNEVSEISTVSERANRLSLISRRSART